jgi:hypothetical protein
VGPKLGIPAGCHKLKYSTFMLVLPAIQQERILNLVSNAFAVNIKVNLRTLGASVVDPDHFDEAFSNFIRSFT